MLRSDAKNMSDGVRRAADVHESIMNIDPEKLKERLVQAFAVVPYPRDETINFGGGDEGIMVQNAFKGKHWKELPVPHLFESHFLSSSLSKTPPVMRNLFPSFFGSKL